MRMIVVLTMVFLAIVFANTTIELKKGWQLVGVPMALSDMSVFDNKDVEIVWGFDGATQAWSGYSPDVNISQKIQENSLALLQTLEPWQAVWVFSSNNWKLTLDTSNVSTVARNSEIKLYKGWNLVEVPQQSVVSEGFFDDAVVWKYSKNQQWKVNEPALNFPSIDAITASEGLWVKSETTRTIDIGKTLSKLHTFRDKSSMLAYIRKMLQMQSYYPYVILDTPELDASDGNDALQSGSVSSNPESTTNATGTNLQEAGVDESDILKHDGVHLFSADNTKGRIVVTSFEKLTAQDYVPLTQIDMNGSNIAAMYLHNDRLAVLSNTAYYYINDVNDAAETAMGTSIVSNSNERFRLDIFDVSDIQNIGTVASYELDGNYRDSRLIEGRLFLISQFTPHITNEYPKLYVDTVCTTLRPTDGLECSSSNDTVVSDKPTSALQALTTDCNYDVKAWNSNRCYEYQYDEQGAWKYDYDHPSVISEKLIPSMKINGRSRALVTPSKFYAPYKLDQRAGITSISSILMSDGSYGESVSFLGNTSNYYASTEALYLVSGEYPMFFDYVHAKEQQMIYKFALGSAITYEGRGFVEGRMLNQFSMSEYNDYLRVATTVGASWWSTETTNSVYTLKSVNEALQVEGTLSGLGKAGETIHAVRFMGDRGFVVTFKQTDPLYTLDLSDPAKPTKIGALSIPGLSRYLHVVDENRILSIGRNADASGRQQELQVQLFDISDFANPRLADKIQIGSKGSYSEAEYNHKAFAYRKSDLMFGLPYQNYTEGVYKNSSENFGIYQIEGMQINALHTLTSPNQEWGNAGRGVIFDADGHTYGALIKGAHMICDTVQ